MSKTIQIRDIDDEVYAGLRRRAARRDSASLSWLRAEGDTHRHPPQRRGLACVDT